ncbi:NAD(P)-binding protein [Xylariaceae sp. FL1272]|nr:NAD(P)-binding protein [Xylariaceae sp. FL1272]
MSMSRAVLVTGATGNQGGALIQALLKGNADFEILAVSRNPLSPSARRLANQSPKVKLVAGDLEKPDDIFRDATRISKAPIWGVFSVQSVFGGIFDEPEVRQGKALVDAALKNNVKMFVYSSADRGGAASYDKATDVPHFRTKYEIEHHLVDISTKTDMAWTILRPVAFMGNFQSNFFGKVFGTLWSSSLATKPLQLIAASDIGVFAAKAFMEPDAWRNRAISLAGDELTYGEATRIVKERTGEDIPVTYGFVGSFVKVISSEMRMMFRWFRTDGFGADVAELKKIHPDMKTFADWVVTESAFQKRSGA